VNKLEPALTTKLRHVDIHQHWLRERVQSGELKVGWISTNDIPADGLTKPLPRQKHEKFVRLLGLANYANLLKVDSLLLFLYKGSITLILFFLRSFGAEGGILNRVPHLGLAH